MHRKGEFKRHIAEQYVIFVSLDQHELPSAVHKYLEPKWTAKTGWLHSSGFLKRTKKHVNSFPCHIVCLSPAMLAKHLLVYCHHYHTFSTKSPLTHLRAFNKQERL